MKYPNGAETSAKQYIQEYLYPLIPEDGFFTLKNGARISYKQYIEEVVMFEGQTKYNGDAVRLIEATTKRNQGLVSLRYGNNQLIINPVKITNYLNPVLMEKRMKYHNGAETSAVQYIQELGPLVTLLSASAGGFIAKAFRHNKKFKFAQHEFEDMNASLQNDNNYAMEGKENA